MSLGEKIRQYREAKGMTRKEVAERLGVSAPVITGWEDEAYNPSLFNLDSLANVLGVDKADLLTEYDWTVDNKLYSEENMEQLLRSRCAEKGWTKALAALDFAKNAHAGVYRKGGNVPYIYHPFGMACQAFALGVADEDVLSAIMLHDVVEDVEGVTVTDLTFVSPEARELVRLLTKQKGGNEDAYYENISKNPKASLIKCLDRCNNVSSMAAGFSREKMDEYVTETEERVIPLLRVIKYTPEYYDAAFLLNYQIRSLLTAFKRLL